MPHKLRHPHAPLNALQWMQDGENIKAVERNAVDLGWTPMPPAQTPPAP